MACLDSSGILIYKNPELNVNCDSIIGVSTVSNYLLKDKIMLFPNPTENQLAIKLPDDFIDVFSVELLDIQGRAIYNYGSFKEKRINLILPNLKSGQYFVKIRQVNELITKKLIID